LLSHQKIEEDFLVPRQHDANVQSPYGLLPVSIMLAGTSQPYYAHSSHTTLQEEATSILTQGAVRLAQRLYDQALHLGLVEKDDFYSA
jgi:hypothetical protein